jgi:hypothetical protein
MAILKDGDFPATAIWVKVWVNVQRPSLVVRAIVTDVEL